MESNLVTERAHDVVAVCPETDDDTGTTECEDPEWDGDLGADLGGGPDEVNGGVGADGVGDVVGAVGERGGRGSEDLEERVGILGTVVVVLAGSVNLLNVAREEIPVLLLIDNVLLDTVEGSELDPVEGDGGSVPGSRRGALLGLGELAFGFLDMASRGGRERSDIGVTSITLGVD